jgi:hypothetical protein
MILGLLAIIEDELIERGALNGRTAERLTKYQQVR